MVQLISFYDEWSGKCRIRIVASLNTKEEEMYRKPRNMLSLHIF